MDIAAALQSSGLAPIDAETMLAFILRKDRAYLLSRGDRKLADAEQAQWESFSARRKAGEPVAYILGQREFYGRIFHVDRRVHIPRPSTENLVSMALDFLKEPKDEVRMLEPGIIGIAKVLRDCSGVKTIVDVGTGSGCIAITMALERPDLHIIGIDISHEALDVARTNAKLLGAHGEFLKGNFLDPVKGYRQDFIVVSNPPYIPSGADLPFDVENYEPATALRSGQSGTDAIANIIDACKKHSYCKGWITECLTQQQGQAL